jgi:4-alpha-glucanotransferase
LLDERTSGVLLHATCLPGPYGSGDLGAGARRFIDFLAATGQAWWQMLPVGPVGYANSPYSAQSAFAGNPMLIGLDALVDDGLLERAVLDAAPRFRDERVDFGTVPAFREAHVRAAFARFQRGEKKARKKFEAFRHAERGWLDDFVLFRAIKRAHGESAWTSWDPDLRDRNRRALDRARRELGSELEFHAFEQYQFARQWSLLREYARTRGIGLMGDLPIFVAHDSADVWQNRDLFRLDAAGMPTVVAGVPPDYFSKTGQLWGNPLYRWSRMRKNKYAWWVARFATALERFDAVRLDHFIGFHRHWQVPGGAATAETGKYVPGPGIDLFRAVRKGLGSLPLVAEDLGNVTPEVKALRDKLELPGIKILQFAFGSDPSAPDFLPHNYSRRAVVYTGTHDNDTTVGWWNERPGGGSTRSWDQIQTERETALHYLGTDGKTIHWDMIRMVMLSVANIAIIPAQDLLGLGSEARMNRPGVGEGNWEWRVPPGALGGAVAQRLTELTRTYGRSRGETSGAAES